VALFSQTLFAAWHERALSSGYMQRQLEDLQTRMDAIEESSEVSPCGWRATWSRYG